MIWKARRNKKKKKRQRGDWVSKYRRNLFDCPFAPRHVSLVPRFERLVETSRLWPDVSRIYFRVFRNDHLSFFTPVADLDTFHLSYR